MLWLNCLVVHFVRVSVKAKFSTEHSVVQVNGDAQVSLSELNAKRVETREDTPVKSRKIEVSQPIALWGQCFVE
jgi:hypothetical protein